MIYLDNNASTRPDPEAAKAVLSTLEEFYANPSSAHAMGIKARQLVDRARAQVAALIGAEPSQIVFTSGGTEANNIAILGTAYKIGKGHIITSTVEHPAVFAPLAHLKEKGFSTSVIPVDENGVIDLEGLRRAIRKDTILITIMHANNETGTLEPITEASAIAHERGILFHTDAAQSVGKHPVDVKKLGVDMLSIAGHKLYGPKGVGALYLKDGIDLEPVIFGAPHERCLKPGTENVPGIAGLGKACEVARKELGREVPRIRALRDMLYNGIKKAIPGARANGAGAERLSNTLNLYLPGADANDLVAALKNRVAISAGAACHECGKVPSHVLKAMGLSDEEAFCSVRISLGKYNTEEEIREAARLIAGSAKKLAVRANPS